MEARTRHYGLTVVAVAVTVVVSVALLAMVVRQRPLVDYYQLFMLHNAPAALVLVWMSRLVLRRQPANRAGQVLLAIAILNAAHVAVASFAHARLVAAGVDGRIVDVGPTLRLSELPLDATIPLCLMNVLWVPVAVLMLAILPLLFPDGHLPGPRWWLAVASAGVGGVVLMVAGAIDAWPTSTWTGTDAPPAVGVLIAVGGAFVLGAVVAGFVAFGRRWRASEGRRRRQFETVCFPAGLLALAMIALYPWQPVWIPVSMVGINVLLLAYALAIGRFRLHDVEPVLGRAAVAAILSVVVAATYATVVVGIGSLAGRPFESPVLPVVAVAVVVLMVEPTTRRARLLVDRHLYGADANRTEVMSRLAARASESTTTDEVLADVAELLVRSTGATRAEAWLDDAPDGPVASAGATDEAEPTLRARIDHHGEQFGELRLFARAATDLVPDAPELLADVAHALGLVLRNERLTEQLGTQLAELEASRQRLVEAHDHGRRSLERDIHDGAQSRLIALRLRLAVARTLVGGPDKDRLAAELDDLGHEVDTAVRSLRDLARGLNPPILEQSGPAAALRAHCRGLPIPVTVRADGVGRYPPSVEGAVYFCCLEAIQNAVRHSHATAITVEIDGDDQRARFRVCDDGTGFHRVDDGLGSGLTNIEDRLGALGGRVRIESAPGAGTRVCGEVPAQPVAAR